MAIAAGSIPTAAELDALGGRLVEGWSTTAPNTSFTTTETDCWSVNFTPSTAGTYRFDCTTPADGTSGEQAKYRLYVSGAERRFRIEPMPAGSFVQLLWLSCVVDLTSTATVVVKVTGQRTSGSSTIFCRASARQLYIYKVQSSASGLISA